MPRIFVRSFNVPAEAIDEIGHVNNIEYVRWMQEIATGHSAAQGWPLARYVAGGAGWFVRSHAIDYLRPAFAGDAISLFTWVADFGRSTSRRKYLFYRARDEEVLARAETLWVFVELPLGRAGADHRGAALGVRRRRGRRRSAASRARGRRDVVKTFAALFLPLIATWLASAAWSLIADSFTAACFRTARSIPD